MQQTAARNSLDLPIGRITVETAGGMLLRVFLPCEAPDAPPPAPGSTADQALRQIAAYLAGTLRSFTIPCSLAGLSPFRRRTLQAVAAIPYGHTATYGSLGPARATGTACAANPLPLVIPCHRVLPASGGIGRYRGGAALKQHLLSLEQGDFFTHDLI